MPPTAFGYGLSPAFLQLAAGGGEPEPPDPPAFVLTDLGATLKLALFSDLGVTTTIGDHVDLWHDTIATLGSDWTNPNDLSNPQLLANELDGFAALSSTGRGGGLAGPVTGSIISAAASTVFFVAKFGTIVGDGGPSTAYSNSSLIGDASGYWSVSARTTGPKAQHYQYAGGAAAPESTDAINPAAYQLYQARHAAGQVYIRVADQVESSAAGGAIDAAAMSIALRLGGIGPTNFTGKWVAAIACDTDIGGTHITNVRNLIKAKYPSLVI